MRYFKELISKYSHSLWFVIRELEHVDLLYKDPKWIVLKLLTLRYILNDAFSQKKYNFKTIEFLWRYIYHLGFWPNLQETTQIYENSALKKRHIGLFQKDKWS